MVGLLKNTSGHRIRVWAALACAASIGAVVAQLLSSADALFLSRVGSRHLGTAFAVSSAASVALLWGLGTLADRRDRPQLLYRTSWIALAVVLLLIAGLELMPRVTSAVFLVMGKQIGGALELLLWLVIANRFTAREARKLLPWVVVASGVGATLGALSVGPLATSFGVVAPLWSAAALLLVVAASARLLMRAPDQRIAQGGTRRASAGLWSGLTVLRERPLAKWLAILVASAGVFAPMMYYLLSVTAAAEFGSEVELAGFLGRYRAIVQGGALIVQLVAVPWLSKRLGVGFLLLLAPMGAAFVGVLVGASHTLIVVALAQGATRILDVAFQTPSEQLIQNLLPEELRGRVAGIVGGVAKRSGSIFGGLLASALIVWPLAFHGALLLAALAWLGVAFALWRRFAGLAVAELSGAARLEPGDVAAGLSDPRALAQLRQRLGSTDIRERDNALSLLHGMDSAAVDVVLQLLLVMQDTQDQNLVPLCVAVRRALGAGMPVTRAATQVALSLLGGENSEVSEISVVVLGCSGSHANVLPSAGVDDVGLSIARARLSGQAILEVLIGAGHDEKIMHELRHEISRAMAGASSDPLEDLAERLLRSVARCRDAELQLLALESVVVAMGKPGHSALSVLLASRLRELAEQWRGSGDARLREAFLIAMSAGGKPEMRTLVQALGDRDESVRARANQLAHQAGDAALEALAVASQSGRSRVRIAAVELLADLRPSHETIQALLDRELHEMTTSSRHRTALASMPSAALVRRRLQERVEEAAQAALLALEALGHRVGLDVVARRLARAVSVRSRARALEALDALLPRQLASEMLGALEGSLECEIGGREVIEHELAGGDRLTRDLLVHALGREGRAEYRDSIAGAAQAAGAAADPMALLRRLARDSQGPNARVAANVPNLMETIAALSELALFSDLQATQLEELASVVQWRNLGDGETLMEQGESASSMFFVCRGSLSVVVQSKTVATLGVGEPVGELGLFSEDRRSATVVATSDSLLGMITREDMENLVEEVPGIALRLCRAMSRRLAEANTRS